MKKLHYLWVLLFLAGCGPKTYTPTAEVSYINYQNEEMTLRAVGYGKKEALALEDARIRAIDNLLFRGIPNSSLNQPLIETSEKEVKYNHPGYFNELYNNRKYLTFVSGTFQTSDFFRDANTPRGQKMLIADVVINIASLRRDLVENGIIRRFGY